MKKIITPLLFFVIAFLTFTSSVFAYNNLDNHTCLWGNPQGINFKFTSGIPSTYKGSLNTAVSKWQAKTAVGLTESSSSHNTFNTFNENSSRMGTTSYTCKALGSKEISSSDVAINKTYFDQSSLPATQKATLRLKVSLHEVGHFIGLGHSTAPKAVMKQGELFYDDIYLDDINGYSDLY